MKKIRVNYRLFPETYDALKELGKEKKLDDTEVVELAINKLYEDKSEAYAMIKKALSEVMTEELAKLKSDVNRIRITANVIDRNTQMNNEFWNHWFILNQPEEFIHTGKYKTEELKEVEQVIKDRITNYRNKKLEWESNKKK